MSFNKKIHYTGDMFQLIRFSPVQYNIEKKIFFLWQSKIKWPVTPCINAKFATKLQTDRNIKTSNNFDWLTKDFNSSNCCHETSFLICKSWKNSNNFAISWLKMTNIELVTSWMDDQIRPIMLIMKEAVKIFIRVNIFQFLLVTLVQFSDWTDWFTWLEFECWVRLRK